MNCISCGKEIQGYNVLCDDCKKRLNDNVAPSPAPGTKLEKEVEQQPRYREPKALRKKRELEQALELERQRIAQEEAALLAQIEAEKEAKRLEKIALEEQKERERQEKLEQKERERQERQLELERRQREREEEAERARGLKLLEQQRKNKEKEKEKERLAREREALLQRKEEERLEKEALKRQEQLEKEKQREQEQLEKARLKEEQEAKKEEERILEEAKKRVAQTMMVGDAKLPKASPTITKPKSTKLEFKLPRFEKKEKVEKAPKVKPVKEKEVKTKVETKSIAKEKKQPEPKKKETKGSEVKKVALAIPFVKAKDEKVKNTSSKVNKQVASKKVDSKAKSKVVSKPSTTSKTKTKSANTSVKAMYNSFKNKKNYKVISTVAKAGVLILVLLPIYKLTKNQCDKTAQAMIVNFIEERPFEFINDKDNMNYVTSDFKVNTEFEYEGQKYKVNWVTESDCIDISSSGYATVRRPDEVSKKVQVNLEYKYYLGKATHTYECTIIKNGGRDASEFDVVNKSAVIDGTYDKTMELALSNNGNVRYMYGNFNDTQIYSAEDAAVFATAYKENLGIDSRIELKDGLSSNSEKYTVYVINALLNDNVIQNNTVEVTVKNDDLKVVKLTNNVTANVDMIENIDTNVEQNYDQIIAEFVKDKATDYIAREDSDIIHDNRYCKKYSLYFKDSGFYTMYITKNLGEVIYFEEEGTEASDIDKAECNGVNEFNSQVTFDASKSQVADVYYLNDQTRKLYAYDNLKFFETYKERIVDGQVKLIPSLVKELNSDNKRIEISSNTPTFTNPVYVETFKNMQTVYDYYKNILHRNSYDNLGGAVTVLLDSNMLNDNACWVADWKAFQINPSSKFKYSVASSPEVIAHEFTHAVFSSFVTGNGKELSGINEGYSDVLGIIATGGQNWKMGVNQYTSNGKIFYVRDLINFNGNDVYGKFSESYHDGVWESSEQEEHATCVLIGHVGYKMYTSGLFKDHDVAKIFYESMTFGFDSNSTFVDARRNLIQAAKELGYNDEQVNYIAQEFDAENIKDDGLQIYKTK